MRVNSMLKKSISVILTISILLMSCLSAYAGPPSNDIIMGDGYIIERQDVLVNGNHIAVEKITYENNTAILKVTENGITETSTFYNNYQLLKKNLTDNTSYSTRASGFDYRYLTTFTDTEHLTPTNYTYAGILATISASLGIYGLPGSVATGIASVIVGLAGSPTELWITTTRKYYEVYDKAGNFLGYYYVEYTIKTEGMINGKRGQLDYQTGNYTTTEVL